VRHVRPELIRIRHPVQLAIVVARGAVAQPAPGDGDFALVGHAIAVAVGRGAAGQVALVEATVAVAVAAQELARVENSVGVAVAVAVRPLA